MRQKELRIALVCYGGVSLAVYMHGVTKEIWNLARASRDFLDNAEPGNGVRQVYREFLQRIEQESELRLRILPDILTGASAGGINAVFLAQAVHSGQSLEPVTELWLEMADVDRLIDPDARPWSRVSKWWAMPFVWWLLKRPGNAVSESVAPETRSEVRRKVSHLIRGRWFEPPFSGIGFSRMLHDALVAMAQSPTESPLLPPNHPLDLFVTATDFRGYVELLRLNSPPVVEESEHRMPIAFRARTPAASGQSLAAIPELVLSARSTASFPGAFPPLKVEEIDRLADEHALEWSGRDEFLGKIMPVHVRRETADDVALIDGSVLVNAPFAGAIAGLRGRPAQREVDRRFIYIDPRPDRLGAIGKSREKDVGFFSAIFGSLSTIPREQPIRDNLEVLEQQSREAERLRVIVAALRPEVERTVEKLFGMTLFLDRPTPKRLKAWRNKAQQAAAEQAGYAFHSYAQAKLTGILERLAGLVHASAPGLSLPTADPIVGQLRIALSQRGLTDLANPSGGASAEAIDFFRAHDIGFRIRRMRLLARRLAREWESDPEIDDSALEEARETVYEILAMYFEREGLTPLGDEFAGLSHAVFEDAHGVLDHLSQSRLLPEVDDRAEEMLSSALEKMPKNLRRRMLLAYLGFPFYDVATLPLLRNEGLTEFDPVKVDRISPEDARAIREGGTSATLRGTEFYNFGAFFSRAYRENDYLWGRLHGAERLIDIVCSTLDAPLADHVCNSYKRAAFHAILDEEAESGRCRQSLLDGLRAEIGERTK
ncbi:patatin-like protein [Qipengyuania oceanensis]|uniref:Patatin-like protein n=1 Tax=Qipengyuania oceanensis TaxID=1463597 RepID=A0A844YBV2_9SPHN|nr:patatin-like protein [Qipengyuania oceanensis]MXO61691.1 patatin-like protein [Qipengyuania oceanensis]